MAIAGGTRCPHCLQTSEPGARICQTCGEWLVRPGDVSDREHAARRAAEARAAAEEFKRKQFRDGLLTIGVVVAIGLGVGVGVITGEWLVGIGIAVLLLFVLTLWHQSR